VGYGLTGSGWGEVKARMPPGMAPARARMPARPLMRVWGTCSFPRAELWTGAVDVVHGTNFVVPPARAARLVSVWDLTALRYPELCTPTSRRYPSLVGRAIGSGAWVHTGSRFVAGEIVEHFGIDAYRVMVIPPGVDLPAAPASTPAGQHGPPYVLAIGTVEPRKDLPGLVRAFDILAGEHRDAELWIAGPAGWAEPQLAEAIAAASHRDRIRRLGWLADIGEVLRGASVLAYPSLYEGFGFPPLEAMAAGVPVVATSAGSVPEVVADAALLAPPGDAEALATALACVLDDSTIRAGLVKRGAERVRAFSWDSSAAALHDCYRSIAANVRR
jgi:glycosyltransferase involved in cell wall biosynthesis